MVFYLSVKLIKKVFLQCSVCRYVVTDEGLSYVTDLHYTLYEMTVTAHFPGAL
jgi:hypothetical protein